MNRIISLGLSISFLLFACGSKNGDQTGQQDHSSSEETSIIPVGEDQIIMQLSGYLIADSQTQGEQDQRSAGETQ